MRVAFDGYWWTRGPAANRTVQRELITAWARRFPADEIVVFVRRADGVPDDLPTGADVRTVNLWPHGASNVIELGHRARRAGADVVVAHNFTPFFGPSAVFIHDAMFVDQPAWFSRSERIYFSGMLPTARRASLVTTSTRAEARRLERLLKRTAVSAIGLAVPSALTDAVPRVPSELNSTAQFALTVGRLNVRKNLESVIAGAASSERITPESPLYVVGSSEHSGVAADLPAAIQQLVSAGTVRFLGRVDDDELAWLYSHAAVTISLSRDEGFGLTPVEAAWFGSPLVVSDIPPHRETVGRFATLVSPDESPENIAAAIDATWGRAADANVKSAALDEYSWDRAVDRLRAAIVATAG